MSIAAATIRMRPARGPALGKAPLPFTATVVSGILHVVLAAVVVLGARAWSQSQPKTYVVNLVPAVAAVGSPHGQTTPAPTLPPRAEEVARPEPPPRPAELPQRETPPRSAAAPEMPPRARELPSLPERASMPRPSATPRAGDKELPTMTGPSTPKAMPDRVAPDTVARAAPPPPAPLGRADGSPQGAGALTLNVGDFPFAWYLRSVNAKITERWAGKAIPGQQPVAVFDINRDGRVTGLAIEKPSGNPYYDQAALRAITEAAPFPPLPPDFAGPVLRVHLGFNFSAERG